MNKEPSCSAQISKSGDENSEHKGTAEEKDEKGLSKTTTSQENDLSGEFKMSHIR